MPTVLLVVQPFFIAMIRKIRHSSQGAMTTIDLTTEGGYQRKGAYR
jgi:hypothetical protein